jgi:hypothetical protein
MFFPLFFHGMSLAQAAGESQAPNWRAAGKSLHRRDETISCDGGNWKRKNGNDQDRRWLTERLFELDRDMGGHRAFAFPSLLALAMLRM